VTAVAGTDGAGSARADPPTGGSAGEPMIRRGLMPGDIGRLVALHGTVYAEARDFDHRFEAFVAGTMDEFFSSWDAARDAVWLVERDGRLVGAIALKARSADEAQLRYLVLHAEVRGRGLGHRLMQELIACARERGYRRITLWTEAALDAAARLYRAYGFACVEERPPEPRWGGTVVLQRYELRLDG
jgi:N-acetylglutamate synthase-like GNAT family acetyltransferase